MSFHWIISSTHRPVPIDTPDIHESWCTCSDCQYDAAKRGLRLDLLVIALGIAAALAAIAGTWLTGLAR
jgi:hypothetical protein